MAALDAAHAALALGLPTIVSPRMSSGDPRPRHLGLSHHTRSVLELLLGGVEVPVPARPRRALAARRRASPASRARGGARRPAPRPRGARRPRPATPRPGLPQRTMGRNLDEDRLFFAAPLAAGPRAGRRRLSAAVPPRRVRGCTGRGPGTGPKDGLRVRDRPRLPLLPRRSMRASRRCSSTSSPTSSSSAGSRATRLPPTAPTCSSTAPS